MISNGTPEPRQIITRAQTSRNACIFPTTRPGTSGVGYLPFPLLEGLGFLKGSIWTAQDHVCDDCERVVEI